jgi:hypothetical protein
MMIPSNSRYRGESPTHAEARRLSARPPTPEPVKPKAASKPRPATPKTVTPKPEAKPAPVPSPTKPQHTDAEVVAAVADLGKRVLRSKNTGHSDSMRF